MSGMGNIIGLEAERERKGERLGVMWDCWVLYIFNKK